MRRFLLGLFALLAFASPVLAGTEKPLVIIAGKTQVIPSGDTLNLTLNPLTTNISGSTQCVQANSAGLLSGAGAVCSTATGTVTSVTCGTGLSGGVITTSGTCSITAPVTVALGGTNATSASGAALDNISGFASTGFLTRTGAGTYAFQSATNGITLGNLAQSAANTVLGNATASLANVTALSLTDCHGANSAVTYTAGTGFGCNTISPGTGTVTHTAGALTSGQLIFGNGAADIAVGDLSGDVSTSGSGLTTIGALKVATGMIQANAVTLAKLATQADKTILANISGSTAVPTASGLSAVLDNIFSSTQGAVLYRDASTWQALAPGTSGQLLQSGGAAANPSWVTASAGGVYTQGTWTPVLKFGGGSTGITYSNQNGLYLQIGKLVTVYCSFQLTNKGSSTGNATVSGLPFNVSTGSNIFQVVGVATTSTFTGGFNLNFGQAGGVANDTIALFNISETLQISNTSFTNTTQILFTASYFTN